MTRAAHHQSLLLILLAGLAWPTAACSDSAQIPRSALSAPIDFSYACEGVGQTRAPENDESAASLDDTRLCPDIDEARLGAPSRQVEGELFGVVLNRQPPGLIVVQLNPAAGSRRFIDADAFTPGVSPIPVGRAPVRVIRADDWSAFYVLSAGDRSVERVVIKGHIDSLDYETATFDLPGVPADGLALPDKLIISANDLPELWVYDLSVDPAAPTLTVLPLPDVPRELTRRGDDLLITWLSRPVLTRLSVNGDILSEVGLAVACRDTLDNDGDGLIDADDPDCASADDDDESDASGAPRVTALPDALPSFSGAPLCDDDVDNDGDGYTDFPEDPACASADDEGEGLPDCSDGVDNDGDGLTDFPDDPSCYSPWALRERRLPLDGPFHATVIDGGLAGTFVYVLDERIGEILVFSEAADGDLERVAVHDADATPPPLASVPYSDPSAEPREDPALAATRSPALARQRVKNIQLRAPNMTSISASRLRGELWERLIAPTSPAEAPAVPFGASSSLWRPARCAPGGGDACQQPAGDDATWYAFGARVDGRIQQIEAIRRGVPTHRLAQRRDNPEDRTTSIAAPQLSLRGRFIAGRGEPQVGYAFMGAGIEELLEDAIPDEQAARLRRFGVWPGADPEQSLSETWTVTWEGELPGVRSQLGRLSAEATLFDPNAAFCEAGVAPGDWLQLTLPRTGTADVLLHELPVITAAGDACPTLPPETTVIEVPITRVGMDEVEFDPSRARLRPTLPRLDEDAIDAADLSLRACTQALTELDDRLGLPENLSPTSAFTAANLPSRLGYTVRVGEQWAIVGERSGFLHRQRWERATGECVIDDTLDPRLVGRHATATVDPASYRTCPPAPDLLRYDTIEDLTPASERFENPSFALDILPGCEVDDTGALVITPNQQDTRWTFSFTSPDEAATLSVSNSLLSVRVPLLGVRRQVVQIDAAANRLSLLQVRPGDPSVIVILE